jgi:Ran GTPase-activating protein (RanGAP) involved in mRNA processing and transport
VAERKRHKKEKHRKLSPREDFIGSLIVKTRFSLLSITALKLTDACLSSLQLTQLCKAIAVNAELLKVDLSGNDFSESAAADTIGIALRNNQSLHSVSLNRCKLSGDSFRLLARALTLSPALRSLSLSDNGVRAAELVLLCPFIRASHSLSLLDLSRNSCFRSRGASSSDATAALELFVDALRRSTSLTSLFLGHCALSDDEAMGVLAASCGHRSWMEVDLSGWAVGESRLAALRQVLSESSLHTVTGVAKGAALREGFERLEANKQLRMFPA